MAGEQRRRMPEGLEGDVGGAGGHYVAARDPVHPAAVSGRHDHLVTGGETIQVGEGSRPGRAVPGDDHVPPAAGLGRSRPPAGPPVDGGEGHAFAQLVDQADAGDLDRAPDHLGGRGPRVGRERFGSRERRRGCPGVEQRRARGGAGGGGRRVGGRGGELGGGRRRQLAGTRLRGAIVARRAAREGKQYRQQGDQRGDRQAGSGREGQVPLGPRRP